MQRRLDPASRSPLAVAVSGGADSIAALLAAASWAKDAGRTVVVLSVDHRLQPQSANWTAFVEQMAARLSVDFRALPWIGEKPATGLAAAARAARHRLLAQGAREAGAQVIVTGHTASDAAENAALGQGALSEWSPSPVWPEGRGVFLLRPLLDLTREAVRSGLAKAGEAWIDDPANDDLRHPRVRVRQGLAHAPVEAAAPCPASLVQSAQGQWSGFRLDRRVLAESDPQSARRMLAAALTCAGGQERPARAASVAALLDRLCQPGPVTATLAGARLVGGDLIDIARNAGERARGGLAPLHLTPDRVTVWDGRYDVEIAADRLTIDRLSGHVARLPPFEQAALSKVPAAFRPALPVILGGPAPTCPILAPGPDSVSLRDLTFPRFLAACGAIAQESELAQGAHGATLAGVLCSTSVRK